MADGVLRGAVPGRWFRSGGSCRRRGGGSVGAAELEGGGLILGAAASEERGWSAANMGGGRGGGPEDAGPEDEGKLRGDGQVAHRLTAERSRWEKTAGRASRPSTKTPHSDTQTSRHAAPCAPVSETSGHFGIQPVRRTTARRILIVHDDLHRCRASPARIDECAPAADARNGSGQ